MSLKAVAPSAGVSILAFAPLSSKTIVHHGIISESLLDVRADSGKTPAC